MRYVAKQNLYSLSLCNVQTIALSKQAEILFQIAQVRVVVGTLVVNVPAEVLAEFRAKSGLSCADVAGNSDVFDLVGHS